MTSNSKTVEPHDLDWVIEALNEYEGPLIRYAHRFTGDSDLAHDVVQDAFLRLCRADRSKIGEHLGAWLYTVCRNRALDVLRKEKRMDSWSETAAITRPGADPPPEAALAMNEDYHGVLSALADLPPKQQEVVQLRFQGGLSYREISEVTGLSVSNVGYLLHMAIKGVRLVLDETLGASGGTQSGTAEGRA